MGTTQATTYAPQTPPAADDLDSMIDAAVSQSSGASGTLGDDTEGMIARAAALAASNPAVLPTQRKLPPGAKGRDETLRTPTAERPSLGLAGDAARYVKETMVDGSTGWSDTGYAAAMGGGDAIGQLALGAGIGLAAVEGQALGWIYQKTGIPWIGALAEIASRNADRMREGSQLGRHALRFALGGGAGVEDERIIGDVQGSAAYKGASAVTQAAAGLGAGTLARSAVVGGNMALRAILVSYYGTSLADADARLRQAIESANRRRIAAGKPPVDGATASDILATHAAAAIEAGIEKFSDRLMASVLAKSGQLPRTIAAATMGASRLLASAGIEGAEEAATSYGQKWAARILSPELAQQERWDAISELKAEGVDPFAPGVDTDQLIAAKMGARLWAEAADSFIFGAVGGAGAHVVGVAGQQQERHGERSRCQVERVDQFLQHERYADDGELGADEQEQRGADAKAESPQLRPQAAERVDEAGARRGRESIHAGQMAARSPISSTQCIGARRMIAALQRRNADVHATHRLARARPRCGLVATRTRRGRPVGRTCAHGRAGRRRALLHHAEGRRHGWT